MADDGSFNRLFIFQAIVVTPITQKHRTLPQSIETKPIIKFSCLVLMSHYFDMSLCMRILMQRQQWFRKLTDVISNATITVFI